MTASTPIMGGVRRMLLSVCLLCAACVVSTLGARESSLPFALPAGAALKESHINSVRHDDSLMNSTEFDTTHAHHSILETLSREDDTSDFADWLQRELRHHGRSRQQQVAIWTVFAPSNSAVAAFRANKPPADELAAVSVHLIPNQSFVLFESLPLQVVRLDTLRHGVHLYVCDMETHAACDTAAADLARQDGVEGERVTLLHSEVVVRNRIAGNGVVHVIDRVLHVDALATTSLIDASLTEDLPRASSRDLPSPSHRPCHNCPTVNPRHAKDAPPPNRIGGGGVDQLRHGFNDTDRESRAKRGDHTQDKEYVDGDSDLPVATSPLAGLDSIVHPSVLSSLFVAPPNPPPASESPASPSTHDVRDLPQPAPPTQQPATPPSAPTTPPPPPPTADQPPHDRTLTDYDGMHHVAHESEHSSDPTTWSVDTWLYLVLAAICFTALLLVGVVQLCCPACCLRAKRCCCCWDDAIDEVDFDSIRVRHSDRDDADDEIGFTRPLIDESAPEYYQAGRPPPDL